MNGAERRADEEAIACRLRLRDAGAEDWPRFTEWLAADPAHARAYAAVALADDAAPAMLARMPASRSPAHRGPTAPAGRRAWPAIRRFGVGLAAVAALILGVVGARSLLRPGDLVVRTGPGERRSLTIADGTTIELNGDTRIVVDGRSRRSVRLVSGEASFLVRHDPASPFEVAAGETRLRDVGTAFDVVRTGDAVDVAVADGAVLVNPDADNLTLRAGDAAHDPEGSGMTIRSRVDPSGVGGWRAGRLVFARATLGQVAAALARSTGFRVTAAPAVASRGFDGIIIVHGDREALFRRLGPLLGVAVERDGRSVRLAPLSRAER